LNVDERPRVPLLVLGAYEQPIADATGTALDRARISTMAADVPGGIGTKGRLVVEI
jgi:hypothetical protein